MYSQAWVIVHLYIVFHQQRELHILSRLVIYKRTGTETQFPKLLPLGLSLSFSPTPCMLHSNSKLPCLIDFLVWFFSDKCCWNFTFTCPQFPFLTNIIFSSFTVSVALSVSLFSCREGQEPLAPVFWPTSSLNIASNTQTFIDHQYTKCVKGHAW